MKISAYVPENDERLGERRASGIWDDVSLASQEIVLGRVDGVELELTGEAGELTVFCAYPEQLADGAYVLVSPRSEEAERWAASEDVRAQLETLRAGGWERSEREAETIPVIDSGRTVPGPRATRCRS